jgi:hypothetical protein
VVHDDAEGHHQSRRVTAMARLALDDHGADWIIHNDADEFWWPVSGSLLDVFAAIPEEYGQLEVRRVNFLPASDRRGGPFYADMIYRERASLNLQGTPLETKRAHRPHPKVVMAPGNHALSGAQLRPSPVTDMLEIFHFPMRDYEQFERKVVQIGTGYEMLPDRSPGVGQDQLELLAVHRRGGLRDYFDAAVLDEEQCRQRLEEGSIVLDRRLESFMDAVAAGRRPTDHAGGVAVRALIAGALHAESALRATREELARCEAELARGEAEHAAALAREQWLHTQLVDASDQLIATRAELDRLRDSRTMRWTAPLRRRWHRLTRGPCP